MGSALFHILGIDIKHNNTGNYCDAGVAPVQVICLIANCTIGLLLNPIIDSGVLNYSKLYENGGLVAGPAALPDSFNGSFVEIDEWLVEGRRYDNTQTSLQD